MEHSSVAANKGRRKRPAEDQLRPSKRLRTSGSTALDEFIEGRDDISATSSDDEDDRQQKASTVVSAQVGRVRLNRLSGPVLAMSQDSSQRASAALSDQQTQLHVCIDRDCDFKGSQVYFKGVVNQTISKLCIACRALKHARERYRREWGTNADLHEDQLMLYMKAQLQIWTNYHGRFGCIVLDEEARKCRNGR